MAFDPSFNFGGQMEGGGFGMGMGHMNPSAVHVQSTPTHQALVTEVKELQKCDQVAREQWQAFTDHRGDGRRDPMKHTEEFLSAFLAHFRSGARLTPTEEALPFVDMVKALQRKIPNFRQVWVRYCQEFGGGTNDAAKHNGAYFVSFFDWISVQALTGLGQPPAGGGGASWGGSSGFDGNPRKRMRDGSGGAIVTMGGMGGGGVGGASAGHAQLVAMVKNFQKIGEAQRELWATYVDTYFGGVRDPSRHTEDMLREFCVNHHVPEVPAQAMGGDSWKGGGGWGDSGGWKGGKGGATVGAVGGSWSTGKGGGGVAVGVPPQPQQRSWSGGGGGSPAPPPAIGLMDPVKHALVERVKAYQKGSRDQAEIWKAFAGTTFDPARHEANKLEEFVNMYGVP